MFSWRTEVRPGVWVAFTDAAAGNLALHVGDDPAAVRRRRARLEAALGLGGRSFQYMNQVHGSEVASIGAAAAHGSGTGAPAADAPTAGAPTADAPTADAMVSLGEPLAVMVADCVPVVLLGERPDGETPVLAVVHAGRPGVASGVVPAAVARMLELGAAGLSAWIGPSVCGGCYEVPGDMREDVAALVPAARCTTTRGTPGLDLPAAVRSQLRDASVRVEYSGSCTLEDERLFSYRRDRHTGRFAGLVWTGSAPAGGGLPDE
ncbi:polyphenol oxidase family protein [Arthrobacter sp. U41]|uniref:polyphenol oxidase family protein n=1 Tax=Arthrobacter sp. U41 TaxID=1849032 RepID=UPI000859394D|nr:polyphenol oxidase family protein [Arthrobacter sp. U41]AOT04134.1 copper oxidase [Arthrobacter sp. U41]